MAGAIGVDPTNFTVRELVWMRDGKMADQWTHTSSVMAMIANTVRDPKKKKNGYAWTDFYPLQKPKTKIPKREKVGIDVLKVFLRKSPQSNGVNQTN